MDLRGLLPRADTVMTGATPSDATSPPPVLIAVLGTVSEETVVSAAEACRVQGDCILWVRLDYDGEGAVFSELGLQALGVLRQHSNSAQHACFWHMSDWLPLQVQQQQQQQRQQQQQQQGARSAAEEKEWVLHLAPQLDVACMPAHFSSHAPADTRVDWDSDVNTQLRAMLRAFNPSFYIRHTFHPGIGAATWCTYRCAGMHVRLILL